MVHIDEKTYVANEQARLDSLADLILSCGISKYEIAQGSRVKYDTILRALRRQVIRPENEARIRLYIKIRKENGNQENQTDRP